MNTEQSPQFKIDTYQTIFAVTALGLVAVAGCSPDMTPDERNEIAIVEEARGNIETLQISSISYLLREGVAIRETPFVELTSEDDGNITSRVGDGWRTPDGLIIKHGLAYTDSDGNEWLGFQQPNSENDEATKEVEFITAQEVAQKLNWVLLSELSNQTNDDDKPYAEPVDFFEQSGTVTLTTTEQGEFFGVDSTGDQVEIGQAIPADIATIEGLNEY